MLLVIANTWALLLGVMLLMVGNGVQGTLLGVRGAIEGFSTFHMSVVMSAYFAGFLLGSRAAPELIRRVGHVRVFAAFGSLISAMLVLYAVAPNWIAWALMRVVMGFCFAGVYVTAESWLNNASTNETRGQTLSAYMIVQMVGIIASQALMNVGDAGGYLLFVLPSVLVSLAFTPILLSASPAPVFETTKPMDFRHLFTVSPLGCVGMFLMGGVYSATFGMASVWGTLANLSVAQISIFVAAIYFGGMVFQYPLGRLSDRMDRRRLILVLAAVGAGIMALPSLTQPGFEVLLVLAVLIGGISNPVYALLIAHTNDYLDPEDMAAASGGLLFINGLGAIAGPLITGWIMGLVGPRGFFLYIGVLLLMLTAYAGWRTTRRPAPAIEDTGTFATISPVASALAVEAVLEATPAAEIPDGDGHPDGSPPNA